MATRLAPGIVRDPHGQPRCWWCGDDPLYQRYHDVEWGFPVTDDQRLFEKICLEGFQSGLSWLTILRKREGFRRAFAGFDFHRMARFRAGKADRLMQDAGIVRHRGKIESALANAKRAVALVDELGSLAAYFWRFEPTGEQRPGRVTKADIPSTSPQSVALAKDLKARGWSFVGPTTAYAFMQAMGLVDDHLEGCATRIAVERARAKLVRPS